VRYLAIGFLAGSVLCGCATPAPSLVWTKGGVEGGPRALRGQLETDIYVCDRWSRNDELPNEIDTDDFRACMIAFGWEPMETTTPRLLSRLAGE
jgi:hypothetical protein